MKKLNKNTTFGRQQDDIYTYLTHPNQNMAQEEQINRCLKSSRPKISSTVPRRCLSRGALILLIVNIVLVRQIGAQFLFTYEINNESDDSRAPKSSLFDPSSFKIVTPSQLQSSYQKLSAQPPEQAPNAPQSAIPAPVTPTASLGVQPASTQAPSSASFLKQTSAALQSFAELFSLAPSSSPSPLSPTLTHHQVAASSPPVSHLDQQAEAKSLHEHWTQQQQKAHLANQQHQQQQQQPAQTAFQSFTTQSSLGPQQQQQQSASPATPSNQPAPPGSYWLTANPLSGPDGSFLVEIKTPHQQQPSSSSSSSSSSSPSSASSQQSTSSLVESLLALSEPDTTPPVSPTPSRLGGQQFASPATSAPLSNPRQSFRPFTTSSSSGQASTPSTSAQSSFLATPTSYYPNPSQLAASPTPSTPLVAPPTNSLETNSLRSPANSQPAPTLASFTPQSQPNLGQHQHNNHHLQQSQPLHSHQARSLVNNQQQQQQQSQRPQFNRPQQDDEQLQPPANAPENFLTSVNNQPPVARVQPVVLKSAEESLISFRQQQDRQHEQQNSLIAAQQQLAQRQRQQQQQQERHHHHHPESVATGNELNSDHLHHNQHHARNQHVALGASNEQEHQPLVRQQLQPPANQPPVQSAPQRAQQPSLGEIPKVSPQIYESFLLQQKDQHEKHMELLKQQQELNKLLEQKQKQQEAAEQQKRKQRKKDDLEKQELRRKEAAEAAEKERARKARLEAEEARRKQLRRKQEEEERRRKAAEEERKYRELLEAREREEKRQRELAAAEEAERQREAEAAAAAAEKKRQQQAAEEAAKYKNYLRQQEELKKLLELKQREDEAAQARQKAAAEAAREQATSANEQTSSSPRATRLNQASRANKLAQEHKQRTSSWGAPIRGSRVGLTGSLSNDNSQPIESSTLVNNYELSTPTIRATTTTTTTTSLAPTTSTTPAPRGSSLRHSQVQRTRLGNNKKRTDEKLIRDKIPLYSGAGKYGLYRSGNESLDLAALLDSVTLPSSTTTTTTSTTTSTTTTTTTTPAPASDLIETDDLTSTSLSPLLAASHSRQATPAPSVASSRSPNEPAFDDDDVPRRPSRTLVRVAVARPPVLPTPQSLTRNVANPARLDPPAAPANQTHGARTAHIGLASLPADSDNDGIPGRAGVEYPVLSAVPPTSFSCSKQPLNGYYADTETACQVVHLCQGGVQSSILCPNGTIFNQEKFSCQWWYEVNCSRAPMFYQLNDNLYKALPGSTGDKPLVGDINKLATTTNNAKRTRTSGV